MAAQRAPSPPSGCRSCWRSRARGPSSDAGDGRCQVVTDDCVDTANHVPAPTATAVLDHVVRALVDDPEAVHVERRRGPPAASSSRCGSAPGDMGRVIGRRGRTAQSIRTVVRAAADARRRRGRRRLRRLTSLLEVGRGRAAHGVRGEVVVELVTDRTTGWRRARVLASTGGPLTVVASRPHQGRWHRGTSRGRRPHRRRGARRGRAAAEPMRRSATRCGSTT